MTSQDKALEAAAEKAMEAAHDAANALRDLCPNLNEGLRMCCCIDFAHDTASQREAACRAYHACLSGEPVTPPEPTKPGPQSQAEADAMVADAKRSLYGTPVTEPSVEAQKAAGEHFFWVAHPAMTATEFKAKVRAGLRAAYAVDGLREATPTPEPERDYPCAKCGGLAACWCDQAPAPLSADQVREIARATLDDWIQGPSISTSQMATEMDATVDRVVSRFTATKETGK